MAAPDPRRIVVAVGGNAMVAADGSATPQAQRDAIERAMAHVAELVAAGSEVVLTHGNGPQVGNLLVRSELAATVVPAEPLDWCVAQTQGSIGVLVIDALERALERVAVQRPVASVITRSLVDADDPGFTNPTKPIGRYLPYAQALPLIEAGQDWQDRGPRGWRRVVASPEPLQVLEAPTVRTLLAAGYVVVAAGGGGIPVVRDNGGGVRGVEAVLDKDLTAALLATELDASMLLIATDVEHAVIDFRTPRARPLGRVSVAQLRKHQAEGHFASGSMGPKVEAVLRFVEAGGDCSVISSLDRLGEAAAGRSGTIVEPG